MRLFFAAAAVLSLLLAGCAGQTSRKPQFEVFPDMKRQAKAKAQEASAFFADGRASRMPVPGTVAQGQLLRPSRPPLDGELLARGQERFNIYCAPCHDRTGSGRGIVGQRSLWLANSLHDDRIRDMGDDEIFEVITHGRRTMPGYRFQVSEEDRWAIVAYVRALQRSTSGTIEDVPEDLRRELR